MKLLILAPCTCIIPKKRCWGTSSERPGIRADAITVWANACLSILTFLVVKTDEGVAGVQGLRTGQPSVAPSHLKVCLLSAAPLYFRWVLLARRETVYVACYGGDMLFAPVRKSLLFPLNLNQKSHWLKEYKCSFYMGKSIAGVSHLASRR